MSQKQKLYIKHTEIDLFPSCSCALWVSTKYVVNFVEDMEEEKSTTTVFSL